MAWYNAGTIAVTGGSTIITGTDTTFVGNVSAGDALRGPDERIYEILTVVSNTQLTLRRNYTGSTASAQAYSIIPLQDVMATVALRLSTLIEDYQAILDGPGAGKFADGTVALPGISFINDQDTGLWRPSSNAIAIATGGVERMRVDTNGNVGVGAQPAAGVRMYVRPSAIDGVAYYADNGSNSGFKVAFASGLTTVGNDFGAALAFQTNNVERMRIAASGDVGISTVSPVALLDLGGGAAGQKLLVYSAGNTRYGLGIGDSQMRHFAASNGALTFGQISTTDGTTFTERMRIADDGNVGIGTATPGSKLHVAGGGIQVTEGAKSITYRADYAGLGPTLLVTTNDPLLFATNNTVRARIDTSGNLLVGSGAGTSHVMFKTLAAQTDKVLDVGYDDSTPSMRVYGAYAGLGNVAHCAANFGHSSTTSRSINAGGTINASGADYAEYMVKSASCGTIAKGDVCGIDADGKLVTKWSEALSFVVKSTDPSLVGGDIWGNEDAIGARPVIPEPLRDEPVEPQEPVQEEDEEEEEVFNQRMAEWQTQYNAYSTSHAAWVTESTAHATAMSQYEADLATWEAALEEARQKVDRIAFSGQVPCNVTGAFASGDYIIAQEGPGDTIRAVAVSDEDITFTLYKKRIGKVYAVRDDRAWIDVQHG